MARNKIFTLATIDSFQPHRQLRRNYYHSEHLTCLFDQVEHKIQSFHLSNLIKSMSHICRYGVCMMTPPTASPATTTISPQSATSINLYVQNEPIDLSIKSNR